MKLALFIGGEVLIFALLAGVLFFAVLWQPLWVWFLAPSAMFAGFVAIMLLVERRRRFALALVLLCPLTYTFWLLSLGMLSGSGAGFFFSVAGYYGAGALLLWLHLLLNARIQRARD
jgi:hypothetical protein